MHDLLLEGPSVCSPGPFLLLHAKAVQCGEGLMLGNTQGGGKQEGVWKQEFRGVRVCNLSCRLDLKSPGPHTRYLHEDTQALGTAGPT